MAKNGAEPLSRIQEFYRFMVDQKLELLEYDHQGLHVRLVRQRPAAGVSFSAGMPFASPAAPGAPPAAGDAAPQPALPPGAATLKSPMMGIFYRASTPSSPPYVKPGDAVKRGAVLCLIEAMKVFNEVKADFDCTILQALIDNGKSVKAGQDLFVVGR